MIQEIGDKFFDNQYKAGLAPSEGDYVFAFRKAERGPDMICLGEGGDKAIVLPKVKDFSVGSEYVYLFSIDDENFFMFMGDECPEGFEFKSNRALRLAEPKYIAFAGMTAAHLNAWYKDNKFCGRCGSRTEIGDRERMIKCPECGNMIFPRINPAVTVALKHDDKLLVTKYNGRQQTNMYALVAGFVEIGESAEECVVREVLEEVGLKAKNVKYYGSQPWGFAGNLQIGYTAEVDGDADIVMDEDELAVAFFISREELEPNDNRPALTQEMIEAFRVGKL